MRLASILLVAQVVGLVTPATARAIERPDPQELVRLAAEASWRVGADICIPGSAMLSLSLPVAAGSVAADPTVAARFADIRRQLPLPAPFEARFIADAHVYFLRVPESALVGLHDP